MNQRLASLEHDTRQPRLAKEVGVPEDEKTRERTEGAAKAVQAMHGDSSSAKRVQDDPTTSTCFGVKADPPALPYRDDVLVENGAAAPKSCLSPLGMRTTTAEVHSDFSLNSRSCLTSHRRSLYSNKDHLRPLNSLVLPDTPGTTAISTCVLPSSAGGLLKQNRGKIGCLILVVLKVVSTPACFWERGARCFVGRFLCVRGLEEATTFFGGSMTRGGSYLAGEVQANHAVRVAAYRCFSAAADLKRSCRRGRLEAIVCQG